MVNVNVNVNENEMKKTDCNFTLTRCGLFINEKHSFLHATPDFLTSCDCCGLGCGEVNCSICLRDCDFEKIHFRKECLLGKSGCYVLPEKAPQLLFSSAAAALHLN